MEVFFFFNSVNSWHRHNLSSSTMLNVVPRVNQWAKVTRDSSQDLLFFSRHYEPKIKIHEYCLSNKTCNSPYVSKVLLSYYKQLTCWDYKHPKEWTSSNIFSDVIWPFFHIRFYYAPVLSKQSLCHSTTKARKCRCYGNKTDLETRRDW